MSNPTFELSCGWVGVVTIALLEVWGQIGKWGKLGIGIWRQLLEELARAGMSTGNDVVAILHHDIISFFFSKFRIKELVGKMCREIITDWWTKGWKC